MLRACAALCTHQILRVRSLAVRAASLRIALMRAGHTETRERRRLTAVVARAVLPVLVLAGGLAGAVPGEAAVRDGLTITSAISDQGLANPDSSLTVTVNVANNSGDDLATTSVSVAAVDVDVSTVEGLDNWLGTSTGARGSELGSSDMASLADGGDVSVPVRIDVVRAQWDNVWGARALLITVDGETGALARQHTAVLYNGGVVPASVSLAVVVPVVAPQDPGQLISPKSLEALASPGGFLSNVAAQTTKSFATLAVDPRIPVSVVAGGTAAPRAVAWWQEFVAGSPNSFLTAYGDADLAGQIQAGASQLLSSGARDSNPDVETALHVVVPVATPESKAGTDSALNASSDLQQGLVEPAQLANGWAPTSRGVAWPVANSVDEPALAAIRSSGSTTVLLSSGNVGDGLGSIVSARVGDVNALVTNDPISAALDRAAAAASTEEWSGAMAQAMVRLAALATDPRAQHAALATLSRAGSPASVARLSTTLAAMQAMPWVQTAGLSALSFIPPVDVALVPHREAPERLDGVRSLLEQNDRVTAFSTIAAEPAVVTDPSARETMVTLAAGLVNDTTWAGRVDSSLSVIADVLASVRVSTDSAINMIGATATLPVAVENGLATPVTVVVTADPRNKSISIQGPVTVKIESRAQAVARFSADAQVSTGSVWVDTGLSSESGIPVGTLRSLRVNVRADWETVGLVAFGAVFVGLMVAGVIRTVRRRRVKVD
jgi:hypothetical protein